MVYKSKYLTSWIVCDWVIPTYCVCYNHRVYVWSDQNLKVHFQIELNKEKKYLWILIRFVMYKCMCLLLKGKTIRAIRPICNDLWDRVWTLTAGVIQNFQVAQQVILEWAMFGISFWDIIRNENIHNRTKVNWQWSGHVCRRTDGADEFENGELVSVNLL